MWEVGRKAGGIEKWRFVSFWVKSCLAWQECQVPADLGMLEVIMEEAGTEPR